VHLGVPEAFPDLRLGELVAVVQLHDETVGERFQQRVQGHSFVDASEFAVRHADGVDESFAVVAVVISLWLVERIAVKRLSVFLAGVDDRRLEARDRLSSEGPAITRGRRSSENGPVRLLEFATPRRGCCRMPAVNKEREWWGPVELAAWDGQREARALASRTVDCSLVRDRHGRLVGVTLRWSARDLSDALRRVHDAVGVEPQCFKIGYPLPLGSR
jgi:hypothetical protein